MASASAEPINNFESNAGSFRCGASRSSSSAPRPEMARRVMDVEEVLIWAYRDELPKDRGLGRAAGEACDVSPMFRGADLGTRVDNWSREPGFPAALGPPHPDALAVETAVAKLQELAEQPIDEQLDLAPDFGALGVDERLAVRRALRMMPAIIARCAKLRQRPFWHSETKPRPLRHANGHAMVVRWEPIYSKTAGGDEVEHEALVQVEPKQKGVYPFGAYSPLRYDPEPQSIVEERAEYLVWWGALNTIAAELEGKLSSIAILPPSAAQRPWNGDVELGKPPKIFADLTARVYRRDERQLAAAHRMLGMRRSSGTRGQARHQGAPVRALRPEAHSAEKRA